MSEHDTGAKLDTFAPEDDGVGHEWGSWSIIKDPDSVAVEERICMNCGRRQFRKARLGPYTLTNH